MTPNHPPSAPPPIAVVLGGSRGIGFDIVEAFVHAGYFTIIASRTPPQEPLAQGMSDFVPCDATIREQVLALAVAVETKFGRPHAWVNNVGVSAWRSLDHIDSDFLDEMLAANLKSAFWGSQAAAQLMGQQGGAITNISSIAGKRGTANNSAYCAAKFGVNGLTQALAKELGSSGVRVNALCPVLVMTDGLREALESETSPAAGDVDAFIRNFTDREAPLGRLPTGADVADMAVFLSSSAATSITGQCINVDCGVLPG